MYFALNIEHILWKLSLSIR